LIPGAGAQQFQRQICRRVFKGHHHHRDLLGRCRRELQRQCGFAHAGGASQQVQPLVKPAQQVIQLAEPRGHAEHGAAGGFALQLASRGVPERCRQPASGSVTWHRSAKRCLRWSFPQGRNKSEDFYICTETR